MNGRLVEADVYVYVCAHVCVCMRTGKTDHKYSFRKNDQIYSTWAGLPPHGREMDQSDASFHSVVITKLLRGM